LRRTPAQFEAATAPVKPVAACVHTGVEALDE